MSASIRVTHPPSAETCWVFRDRIQFMGDVEGTNLTVLEVEVPPGSGTPPHAHDSLEIFRVLAGEISFGVFAPGAPRVIAAKPGTVVTVPPRAPHNYQNTGMSPASLLVVVERSMAAFFRDVGRSDAPNGEPPRPDEIAAVTAACTRHGITLLGAPPP